MVKNIDKKEYDFANRKHNQILTQDELEHFDESMKLKNEDIPADEVDFAGAVQSMVDDLEKHGLEYLIPF